MIGEISFDFGNSMISKKDLNILAKKIIPKVDEISKKTILKNDNPLNSLYQPFDISYVDKIIELSREKKKLHPKIIVIVGIGGSNLGTIAIQKAVIDEHIAHLNGLSKVMYADTVDPNLINHISKELEITLAKGENVLVLAISKSAKTLETLANLEVLINSIKKYKSEYQKYIVSISDENSLFSEWAKRENISYLPIPSYVGGRYSVFSAVSLFPLALLGVNIAEFISGARKMNDFCLNKDYKKNPAILSSAITFYHYKNKCNISNIFLFSKNLEYLGRWYRQLTAESLGKERDLKNKKINVGLTPIVSLGTEDLHSMQQLFIEGPNDKITTFVTLKNFDNKITLPLISQTGFTKDIEGVSLSHLMNSISNGVKLSFSSKKRPFISVELENSKEYCMGQFMMWKMFETVYMAKLMNVNPFDQPGVESYKKQSKKLYN